MIFHDVRLQQLVQMFLQTIKSIEGLIYTTPIQELQKSIQKVIRETLSDQRQAYINSLLDDISACKQYVQEQTAQHAMEIEKIKELYEEQLRKAYHGAKSVELEVKSHIETRMREIERDYVLRVIHEQQIKRLQNQPCRECEAYRTLLASAQNENSLLKSRLSGNDKMEATSQTSNRRWNDSVDQRQSIIYESDEVNESTPRINPRHDDMSYKFQEATTIKRQDDMKPPDLHRQLENIRKSLKERHNRLIRGDPSDQEPTKRRHEPQPPYSFKYLNLKL